MTSCVRRAACTRPITADLGKTVSAAELLLASQLALRRFTPTYSSWLRQGELWVAKIERHLLARVGLHEQVVTWQERTTLMVAVSLRP